jgi:hypothetical protein
VTGETREEGAGWLRKTCSGPFDHRKGGWEWKRLRQLELHCLDEKALGILDFFSGCSPKDTDHMEVSGGGKNGGGRMRESDIETEIPRDRARDTQRETKTHRESQRQIHREIDRDQEMEALLHRK